MLLLALQRFFCYLLDGGGMAIACCNCLIQGRLTSFLLMWYSVVPSLPLPCAFLCSSTIVNMTVIQGSTGI